MHGRRNLKHVFFYVRIIDSCCCCEACAVSVKCWLVWDCSVFYWIYDVRTKSVVNSRRYSRKGWKWGFSGYISRYNDSVTCWTIRGLVVDPHRWQGYFLWSLCLLPCTYTWIKRSGREPDFKFIYWLTFWRRNYFLILAHPVYKMWIIQEPNTLELWNKLHFEEKKKRKVYTMFKIFSTYICWINI